MKSRKGIIYSALLILGIGVLAWLWPESTVHWMQRVSSVHFPSGTTDVSTTGNHEFYVSVHATLPHDTVQTFVNRYGFVVISNLERQMRDIRLDGFESRLAEIPRDGDLVAHSARTKNNRWTYVLDRKTGGIWGTVFFPDMAGDPP